MLASSAAAMDSRLKAWNDGDRGGDRQEAQRRLRRAICKRCNAPAIPLTTAGFATKLIPPSVVLGLDPRTHAGLVDYGHGFQAQGLE
ncbi:UNVERIFIED_ORG: hypothetical protein BTE55_04530 [Rhizobium sophorae]